MQKYTLTVDKDKTWKYARKTLDGLRESSRSSFKSLPEGATKLRGNLTMVISTALILILAALIIGLLLGLLLGRSRR